MDFNKGRGMKTSKEWVWDVKEDFDKWEEKKHARHGLGQGRGKG